MEKEQIKEQAEKFYKENFEKYDSDGRFEVVDMLAAFHLSQTVKPSLSDEYVNDLSQKIINRLRQSDKLKGASGAIYVVRDVLKNTTAPPDARLMDVEISSKRIDELYKEWSGEHHTNNSCRPVHDSAEATDFAWYCMKYYRSTNASQKGGDDE